MGLARWGIGVWAGVGARSLLIFVYIIPLAAHYVDQLFVVFAYKKHKAF